MQGDDLAILLFLLALAATLGLEAVKAETVPRRFVFALAALGCFMTGVLWLQLKPLWPPFTYGVSTVAHNPLAWFFVILFFLAVAAFHRSKSKPSVRYALSASSTQQTAQPQSQKVAQSKDRAFVCHN